ncbi:MAG: ABC transporter permease, partial [Gemmatimonadota bacterium]
MEPLFRLLLLGYPRRFRRRYGGAMLEWFRAHRKRARRDPRRLALLRLWGFVLADWLRNVPAERTRRWRRRGLPRPRRSDSPSSSRAPRLDPGEIMNALLRELRQATRRLTRAPVFSLTAVTIIALAIGGNTAMFTFVDAVLLRPQPFAEPERLVHVYQDSDDGEPTSSSFPAYRDIAAHDEVFSGVLAAMPYSTTMLTDEGAEPLAVEFVTASYFDVLGLSPLAGRGLQPEDDLPGSEPVAVISAPAWRSRFGADADVIGRTLRLQGRSVTVVGVGPDGYGGIMPGLQRDLFLSLSAIEPLLGSYAGGT